jgi:GDP-L-fucose synthase
VKYDKILVTGNGTVGSNFDFGHKINSKIVNLQNKEETYDYITKFRPDAVIHTAAKVGGLKMHLEERYKLYHENIEINTNLIDSAKKNKIPRVLSFLSSCIFSDISKQPYNESQIHDGEPSKVHVPYGHAKRMIEVQSRLCFEQFGYIYNCIIPTNIYGINDDFNLDTGHVVGVLIHKAYLSSINGKTFSVWGDGKQRRDFVFTEDVSFLTKWILENYESKEPLILSNSTPIEIGYIAELIAKKFNIEKQLRFDKNGPTGQIDRILDGSKLDSIIKFKFTSIEDGINKTIDFFIKNYPNIRL